MVSLCNGTITPQKQPNMSTSPCLATSRNASTNSTTQPINSHKTHCTLPPHQCLATNCKNYQQIFLQHLMRQAKTTSSKLWALSSFMLGSWQHSPKSTQHHCTAHCKCNKTHWTMGPSTSWLSCNPSHCNYPLLGKWHGGCTVIPHTLTNHNHQVATLGTSSISPTWQWTTYP